MAATPGKHCRFGPEPVSGSAFRVRFLLSFSRSPGEPEDKLDGACRPGLRVWPERRSKAPGVSAPWHRWERSALARPEAGDAAVGACAGVVGTLAPAAAEPVG